MTDKEKKQFEKFKKEEKRIAKELFYPARVLAAIENSNSEIEIVRIMKTAREKGA